MTDKNELPNGAVAWTVVGPDGKTSIGGWLDANMFEAAAKMAVLREGHSYAFAYPENTSAPGAVAEGPEKPVGPNQCPITGRPFFSNVEHPDLGLVATYGGPFDSYTIPSYEYEDGELRCERYDWDADHWTEGGEPVGYLYEEQQAAAPAPAESKPAESVVDKKLAYEHQRLLYGFMLDCTAVGAEQAGKNLARGIKAALRGEGE